MQKIFEIEQGVPEIWVFKGLEMILLRETKKKKKYHCASVPGPHSQEVEESKGTMDPQVTRLKNQNYNNKNDLLTYFSY